MTKTRRVDGKPETDADRRFFDLRESGYRGPIDQDGYAATSGETRRSCATWRSGAAKTPPGGGPSPQARTGRRRTPTPPDDARGAALRPGQAPAAPRLPDTHDGEDTS